MDHTHAPSNLPKNTPTPVEIACVEALHAAYERAVLWQTHHKLVKYTWDYDLLRRAYEGALDHARAGRREEAGLALVDAVLHYQTVDIVRETLPEYTERCAAVLTTPVKKAQPAAQHLWFDLTHSWRGKGSKGVPTIPDMSQFMVIETIATIFFIIIGIILPITQTTGIYTPLVPAVFLTTLLATTATALLRQVLANALAYVIVLLAILYFIVQPLTLISHRWFLLSFTGGGGIGFLLILHYVYRRSRRLATKYGPLACLWVRKHHKGPYELFLLDSNNTVIWHRLTRHFFWHVEPVIGADQAIDLRGDANISSLHVDKGDWFQCYPALISTRMVGLRRQNPATLTEALTTTPDLTPTMLTTYLQHTPSPLSPPHYDQLPNNPHWTVPHTTPW